MPILCPAAFWGRGPWGLHKDSIRDSKSESAVEGSACGGDTSPTRGNSDPWALIPARCPQPRPDVKSPFLPRNGVWHGHLPPTALPALVWRSSLKAQNSILRCCDEKYYGVRCETLNWSIVHTGLWRLHPIHPNSDHVCEWFRSRLSVSPRNYLYITIIGIL